MNTKLFNLALDIMRASGRAPIDRASLEVIESPSWPPSGKFICGGIAEILPFPPQLRPFVPDCPSNLVGGSAIDVWVNLAPKACGRSRLVRHHERLQDVGTLQ